VTFCQKSSNLGAYHETGYGRQVQSHNSVGQAGLLVGRQNILRLNPELASPIQMDNFKDASSRLPELAKTCFARNKEDIRPFFEEKVTPREKHYSQI